MLVAGADRFGLATEPREARFTHWALVAICFDMFSYLVCFWRDRIMEICQVQRLMVGAD